MCASYLEEKQISHRRCKILDLTCGENGILFTLEGAHEEHKEIEERGSSVACPMHPNPATEDVYGGDGRRWSDSGVNPATEKSRQ